MSAEIWLALIAIVAAPAGGALAAVLTRRKYRVEIDNLRADVTRKLADTRGAELANVRQGNEILMQQIVEPLRVEIKSLRNEISRFRRAVERIPACPYSADCPVSRELLSSEKVDAVKGAGDK
ncbi:MAG: hypothetical protein LBP56_07630 [Odoribacteraceae bacterium]|jgi:hypothetical protein|nr:hypothetical protein [Odoribacteraceae bacterium]